MTQVKVCGVTNIDDAKTAIDNGADFLGLIFVQNSPRAIDKFDALRLRGLIPRGGTPKLVGVFKDATLAEIEQAIKLINFDLVQCHGDESVEMCSKISHPVIKAIEIDPATDDTETLSKKIEQYASVVTYLLFDRPKRLGDEDDWLSQATKLIRRVAVPCPFFIAGGLNPDNVAGVIADLNPFGVDVASGIEISPGLKDPVKLKNFLAAAKKSGFVPRTPEA